MAIWRGVGGSGESTTNTIVNLVAQYTFDAEAAKIAAQASQTAAEAAKVIAVDASASALVDSITAGNAADEASESAAEAAVSAAAAATFDPDNFYTKTASDSLLAAKANQSTTYTKTEADSLLAAKANQSTTYTKTEVDASLATKQAVDTELTTLSGMAANRATFLASEQAFSMRNRIINGDMRIDQRNAGASVTIGNAGNLVYTLDRWAAYCDQNSKFSVQQTPSGTGPTGFASYLGVTSLSAYSVGASEAFGLQQSIEGFNTSDLAWGTASASAVTLSFRVYTSLTGAFGGALRNATNNRSYPFSYTVSAANTWTSISITIPGDTTGTWLTTNGAGIKIWFSLGVGSTFSGTAGVWSGSNFLQPTGSVSVVGTSGATFYITGVQLEAGSVATPFERRPYGTELMLCQRYFIALGGDSSYQGFGVGIAGSTAAMFYCFYNLPASMRAKPSVAISGALRLDDGYSGGVAATGVSAGESGSPSGAINVSVASGLTTGRFYMLQANNSTASRLQFSAEL